MSEKQFRDYLNTRGFTREKIEEQIRVVNTIEESLQNHMPFWTLNDLNSSSVQSLVNFLIDDGKNSLENFYVLLRYAKAIDNITMFNTVFEMLDGCEAMENLFNRLGARVGEELRDTIFEGLQLPPLGISKLDKARYTHRVMRRMEEVFEESFCREVLSESLRILPDEYFAEQKKDFYQTCGGDIDHYLRLQGRKFVDLLYDHQQRDELFFGQEITDDVIHFVKNNPEIEAGVRKGSLIFVTKIPFNTKAYLEEKDPVAKRYHYCHCPWVKESISRGNLKIPGTFCQCSAGFHKKPFEVIFDQKLRAEVLQSVLYGDSICRFAIYLPETL